MTGFKASSGEVKQVTLWLSGRSLRKGEDEWTWAVLGIYEREADARARCRTEFDFVAPVSLNVDAPEEVIPFPGLYYPLATQESNA